MTDPDPLLAALAALDPAVTDPPPAPGSPRDHQILERAMATTTTPSPTDTGSDTGSTAPSATGRGRPRRLLVLAGAGLAAAVLAVVGITVVGPPGAEPDPVAALTEAAATTGAVDTLRVRSVVVDGENRATLEIEVAGRDFHLVARPDPGHQDGSDDEWVTVVGDQQWSDEDPEPTTIADADRPAPFAESSEAVVRAALAGAVVDDLGTEEVGGVEATRYRIELGDEGIAALDALPANQRGWFGLRHPEWITSLEVWVADELVRRVALAFSEDGAGIDGSTRLDYTAFGAAITVEPPG